MTHARPLAIEAQAYAARGMKIFPLWWIEDGVCACDDHDTCGSPGKHPRVRRGVNEATSDGGDVTAWWQRWPHANIGLAAAANDLAILDVDPKHGGDDALATLAAWCTEKHRIDLMATRTVRTGSGGLHLYYRQPPGGIKNGSASFGVRGLDTRGRGGYVVAPPSLHASGQRYEVIDNGCELARWPAVLTRLMDRGAVQRATRDGLQPARPASAIHPQGRGAWAQAALDGECARLRAMGIGSGRNDALNGSAYKIGRKVGAGLIDRTGVVRALYDAVRGWIGSPRASGGHHTERELLATIESGLRAGTAKPYVPGDQP